MEMYYNKNIFFIAVTVLHHYTFNVKRGTLNIFKHFSSALKDHFQD